jgi:hypothetical protein
LGPCNQLGAQKPSTGEKFPAHDKKTSKLLHIGSLLAHDKITSVRNHEGSSPKVVYPISAFAIGTTRALQWTAFACWCYVAAVATLHPQYLPLHFFGRIPIRTDTTGIWCFVLSTALLMVTGYRHALAEQNSRLARYIFAVARSLAFHAAAGWAYLASSSISHRFSLDRPLTHVLPWPSEGTASIVSLATALVALSMYFILRVSFTSTAALRARPSACADKP